MEIRTLGSLWPVSALTLGGGGLGQVWDLLDSPGEMRWFAEPPRPRDIIAAARGRGTGAMGIRAVQAGRPD
jgi:hypothetical protein